VERSDFPTGNKLTDEVSQLESKSQPLQEGFLRENYPKLPKAIWTQSIK
jgi:hypothetical protein